MVRQWKLQLYLVEDNEVLTGNSGYTLDVNTWGIILLQ
jgi:hypothetical protein